MKTIKIFSLFLCVILLLFCFCVPVFAEDTAVVDVGEAVSAVGNTETAGPTWVEQVADYVKEHILDIGFVGYIIYQALPRVGALAKSKKAKKDMNDLLDRYFNDTGNSRSVANILSAGNDSMSRFMGDVAPKIERLAELLPAVKELVEKLKNADAREEKMLDAMLACRESVLLMGKEMETLMLVSGGVGDKKRAEIYAAYTSEVQKMNAIMAAITAGADAEENHDTEKESTCA